MATVKTAISLDAALFEETEQVIQEQKQTRSGLVAEALREYIERYRNRRFLEQMNAVHSEPPSEEDKAFLGFAKRQLAKVVDDY